MKNFTIDRDNLMFLFIDIQDKLVNATFNKETFLKNSIILAKVCEEINAPAVISVQYPKGLGWLNEEVKSPLKNTVESDKSFFNAYSDDKINKAIKDTNKKQIVVAGTETHVCVYQTVRGLLEDGYEVFLAKDAVGSRSEKNHENALIQMSEMGAVITNTETILFDICKISGTEEFKKLQNLIK